MNGRNSIKSGNTHACGSTRHSDRPNLSFHSTETALGSETIVSRANGGRVSVRNNGSNSNHRDGRNDTQH